MKNTTREDVLEAAATLRAAIANLEPMSETKVGSLSKDLLDDYDLRISFDTIASIMGRRTATISNVVAVLGHLPQGMVTTKKDIATALKTKAWQAVGTALTEAHGIADLGACVMPSKHYKKQDDAFVFNLDEEPFSVVDMNGNSQEMRRERAHYLEARGVEFCLFADRGCKVASNDGPYIKLPHASNNWWKPEPGYVNLSTEAS